MAEFSLEEAYGSAPSGHAMVDPAVQKQRDAERLPLLRQELDDPNYDEPTHLALSREISRVAKQAGQPIPATKSWTLDDAYGDSLNQIKHQSEADIVAGGIKAAAVAGYHGLQREAAALGDMALGMTGAAAGSIGEFVYRVHQALDPSISQRSASATGREFREYISEKFAPTWFTDLIDKTLPPEEKENPTAVAGVMTWLGQQIDKVGDKVDLGTGGKINRDDVSMFVNGAMNLLGVKGIAAGGNAFVDRLQKPRSPFGEGRIGDQVDTAEATANEATASAPPSPPAVRAKADIEASLGIRTPAQQAAWNKQRRADVKEAFKTDPEMGDYYQNYANEEARQAEASAIAAAADMGAEAADKAAPSRIGRAEAVLLDEGGRPIPPSTLDLALDKAVKGRLWDLTAEERLALSRAGSQWVRRDVNQPFNRGQIDADLLNILAVGGTGAALAYAYPDDAKTGLAAMAGGALLLGDTGKIAQHAEKAPLSVILKDSATTLKTLERLPQNKWKFSLEEVEQQLRRDDVTKAEKETLGEVIRQQREQGHDFISAKDLTLGFKAATHDFELTERASDQYADYGLENIDRLEADPDELANAHAEGLDVTALRAKGGQPAKTSIWQLPEGMEVSDANHFSDPRYFGHTRSFEENGIKHVVEIQSDLAQKAGKVLSEEERTRLEEDIKTDRQLIEQARANIEANVLPEVNRDVHRRAALRIVEAETKLHAKEIVEGLEPILKNWSKRLVREELAASVRERAKAEDVLRGRGDPADPNADYPFTSEARQRLDAPPIVRFATADTVAKVEGWPELEDRVVHYQRLLDEAKIQLPVAEKRLAETRGLLERNSGNPRLDDMQLTREVAVRNLKNSIANFEKTLRELPANPPRFSPEHQGIYDRYSREVEKFLRQLGGKPFTDPAGHTWIDVPTQPGMARTQIFGRADPNLLTRIAVIGTAAAIGTYLDKKHPIQGGLLGVLSGAFLVTGGFRRLGAGLKSLARNDPSIRVDDLGNEHAYKIARTQLEMARAKNTINQLVPKADRRAAVTAAIERGDTAGLKPNEVRAYRFTREFFEGVKAQALDADILEAARENYVTHLWQREAPAFRKGAGPSMSGENRFAEHRSVPTIARGKELGLTPLTEDIGQIIEIYGNSMGRSIANKALLEGLRAARTQDGVGLVVKASQAPPSYEQINHPQMTGYRIHPEIMPSLRFMFQEPSGMNILKAAEAVNTTIKRLNVSFSLFHAKALYDAATGGFKWGPIAATKHLAQAAFPKLFGENKYLKEIREIGVGPVVDAALKGGLKFSIDALSPSVEDVGGVHGNFYTGMRALQTTLDKAIPYSGTLTVKPFIRLNQAFDHFMWGRLHAGMKLSLFAEKYASLLEKYPNLPRERAGQIAASFTNDIFGGLDWRRIAENARTQIGREAALSLYSPVGRRGLQLAIFAPDWTISTTRAFTQAIKPKIGGIAAPELAKLHQGYLLRSAVYYLVIGDALNMAFTGHHLWENKNKDGATRIELGDGRTMQWSKHTMEVPHMLHDPAQYAINKLGYIPREGISQAFGVDYLSAHGRMPPMKEGRLAHALKSASPIGAQQFDQGTGPGISGMLGAPIYGETAEHRASRLRQQRIERIMENQK